MSTWNIVEAARKFAALKHEGQVRKYTGQPYVQHTCEVAMLVEAIGGTPEMVSAAHLHDTLEDTNTSENELLLEFTLPVLKLVKELTDISKPEDGNRAKRKAIDLEHISKASVEAQTIKLADLISNSVSIMRYDVGFAKVYMEEKIKVLEVLKGGNPLLYKMACDIVGRYTTGCRPDGKEK